MACVEDLNKEVLLSGASFKEAREYVETHCKEIYYVDPGFKLLEKAVIGIPPIAIGVDGDFLILPYTKPCYGTFLLRVECAEEIKRLRSLRLKTRR
ncbi:MAG: DUF1894 domain-containing protein [Methanomicrobiales archaeon]|nr:DUF1894 domain-containing protein [Methanomicrobiales archaeon]